MLYALLGCDVPGVACLPWLVFGGALWSDVVTFQLHSVCCLAVARWWISRPWIFLMSGSTVYSQLNFAGDSSWFFMKRGQKMRDTFRLMFFQVLLLFHVDYFKGFGYCSQIVSACKCCVVKTVMESDICVTSPQSKVIFKKFEVSNWHYCFILINKCLILLPAEAR